MNMRRIGVLLWKEFRFGSANFFLVFAILMPLILSLIVTVVFGTLFAEEPKLAVLDEGDTVLVERIEDLDFIDSNAYDDADELRDAVERGTADVGIVFPASFDDQLASGETIQLTTYIWGQSEAQDRTVVANTLSDLVRDQVGGGVPLEITTVDLGDSDEIPWEDRLLPLIVLVAVVIGGVLVPAASLVDEKEKHTLTALNVTPTALGEVFLAKGIMGAVLSLGMGILVLVINQAFGAEPVLLVVVLALGAMMAALFGILLGSLTKDTNTLFATIKSLGIVLYAPAFLYLFPEIPAWVSRVFPTFYIMNPIIEISQNGADFGDVAVDVGILALLIVALVGAVLAVANQMQRREV